MNDRGRNASRPSGSIGVSTATIGVAIPNVDLTTLAEDEFKRIRQSLDAYSLLIFREQNLTKRDLVDLARRFGDPYVPPLEHKAKTAGPDFPEVYIVSNVRGPQGKRLGALGSGEAVWHSDISHLENPPEASLLYAVEVPEQGGDTSICNMETALVTMPNKLRRQIEGRLTKHDATLTAGGSLRVGVEVSDDLRKLPGRLHPAICVHPRTGREFLYLGRRRNAYIDGLPLQDSNVLLDELWAHATKSENVYVHKWAVGDLLVWDNRTTVHARDAFDPSQRRIMHHVRIKGSFPPQASHRMR